MTDTPEPGTFEPIVRVAAAIATGVGVLGLVALTGGAVLWTRFDAAGLPSGHAVAVVPRDDLIVIGAETLVPLTGIVVGVILAVWLVIAASTTAMQFRRTEPEKAAHAAEESDAAADDADAATDEADAAAEKLDTNQTRRVRLIIGFSSLLSYLYFLRYAPSRSWFDSLVVLFAVLLGAVACARAWRVLKAPKFSLFSGVVAGVIVALGLTFTYFQTRERPLVRPAAVVYTDSKGTAGLFIAETDTNIYIAEVSPDPQNPDHGDKLTGRMIEIPRSRVRGLSIGTSQSLSQALKQAPVLKKELTKRVPVQTPP